MGCITRKDLNCCFWFFLISEFIKQTFTNALKGQVEVSSPANALIQRKYSHALRVTSTLLGGLDVLLSAEETGAKTASPKKTGKK